MPSQVAEGKELKFKLTLLVRSLESEYALECAQKALEFHCASDYEISVVNVIEEPILARSFGVIHTPVIVRHTDSGKVFYSVDFSDVEKMRKSLGFLERSAVAV